MKYFTRREIAVRLDLDEAFITALEEERILVTDAPAGAPGDYSSRMLERARVAHNLVVELEVNLPGVAVIVRMREQIAELRHHVVQRDTPPRKR